LRKISQISQRRHRKKCVKRPSAATDWGYGNGVPTATIRCYFSYGFSVSVSVTVVIFQLQLQLLFSVYISI